MQILRDKKTSIVITSMGGHTIGETGVIQCDNVVYVDCTLDTCDIIEVEGLPMQFINGCYSYDDIGCTWKCEFPKEVEKTFPVPTISMRQARIYLLQQGLLTSVDNCISSLSEEAKITWEYSIEIRRDFPLVSELTRLLNLPEEVVDNFFTEAVLL
jgi:hypothetical protein